MPSKRIRQSIGKPVVENDKTVKVIGAFQDITDRADLF
jgi:hypothetical protein